MIGHLGPRVSALLDGRLPLKEAEGAWLHVQACHVCRDLVEREGQVKTRLAGLSYDGGSAPADLKGSLLRGTAPLAARESFLAPPVDRGARLSPGLVAIGGGALGAAVLGLLALGVAPGEAPANDRRVPVTQLVRPSQTPVTTVPTLAPGRRDRTP